MGYHMLNIEENTDQVLNHESHAVTQVVEPEAERLLVSRGGSVYRYRGGMIYDEYSAPYWPTIAAYLPDGTRCVYVSPLGQQVRQVLFALFSLPGYTGELHLVYDYRLGVPSGAFEPYFTLRLACEQERAWPGKGTPSPGIL